MATATEGPVRVESRDVSRKVDQLESDLRDFKTEMQVSNRTMMETLTQINARLTRLEEAGLRSQESDGRRVHPPAMVDAAANLSCGISRYRDIELDRNTAGEDRWYRNECSVYEGFNMSVKSDKNRLKDSLDQFKKLQQIGSVEDYMQNFKKARFQSECSEGVALELFLEGLNAKLQCLVNLHKPRTVREAFDYATFFDKTLNPNIDYRHCPRFADENGNRAEPLGTDNDLKELVGKEDSEMICEVKEAKGQDKGKELDVVEQVIEGSMEFEQDLRIDAEFSDLCVAEFPEVCVKGEQVRPTVQKTETNSNLEVVKVQANSNMNKRVGVGCLDMVKADECCYQLLVAMVEHVWSGKVLELMLDGWNFSSSGADLLLVKGRTVGVAWDFKKRKKSLRQLVGVLVNNGKIQEQVCFLEVHGTAVQKCTEEDIGISVAEVLNLKLMCHE